MYFLRAAFTVAVALSPVAAAAKSKNVSTPVDLTSCVNSVLNTGGPVGTGQVGNAGTKFSNIPFNLLDPTKGNNAWVGQATGNTLTITVSPAAPISDVYLLTNTVNGVTKKPNETVTVNATGVKPQVDELKGGAQIRDYQQGSFTNTLKGKSTQNWWINSAQTDREDAHVIKIGNKSQKAGVTTVVVQTPANAGSSTFQPIVFAIDLVSNAAVTATCQAQ